MKKIILLAVLVLGLLIVGCEVEEDTELEIVDDEGNVVGAAFMGQGKMRISPAVMRAMIDVQQCDEQKSNCNLLSNWEIVTRKTNSHDPVVSCPEGKKVTGGGCNLIKGEREGYRLADSYPAGDNAWVCLYPYPENRGEVEVEAFAICANVN